MPRGEDRYTVQATLEPDEQEMWQRVVKAVRGETGLRVSEAEVLRKLIRDKASFLDEVSAQADALIADTPALGKPAAKKKRAGGHGPLGAP